MSTGGSPPDDDVPSPERETRAERARTPSRDPLFGEGSTVASKYRLVRLLGKGGMGAVYEAQNLDTLKRCAIKLILDKHATDDRHRARFFREARASSVADSEHIVQVFDCDTDVRNDVPYMVMELLTGESLHDAIERLGMLDPDLAARIVLQAAAGLARAHAAGIVHRDIKPANLFLSHSDLGDVVVKILDFGVAKMRVEQAAGLTQTGAAIGTPVYMAPEQALGHKDVDAGADVWALGVAMFEMLTGRPPFDADNAIELILKITSSDVPLVQDSAAWIRPELADIVHRCLSRDRSRRFRHGGELLDALERVLDDSRITVGMIAAPSEALRAQVAPRIAIADALLRANAVANAQIGRRTRLLVASGAVAALVVIVGAVVALRGDDERRADRTVAPARHDAAVSAAAPVAVAAELALPLAVGPKGVTAEIDGIPAPIDGGTVIVRGHPGDGRIVVLRDRRKREVRQEVLIRSNGTLMPDRLELSDAGIQRAKASSKQVEQAKQQEALPPSRPDAGTSDNVLDLSKLPVSVPL
jgi:eukaryotic-like serine/threonine-protein kinase